MVIINNILKSKFTQFHNFNNSMKFDVLKPFCQWFLQICMKIYQNFHQNIHVLLFCFWKCYVLKFRFRIVEFVWRSPKVLWSLSGLKFGHTFWIFTNRKISLFWYDFVKELFKNSSYRSTKPLNEIVAKNSHTTPHPHSVRCPNYVERHYLSILEQ